MIASTEITNSDIFTFVAMLLSHKVCWQKEKTIETVKK